MTKLPLAGALVLALLPFAGCADSVPTASKTPHNGTLVALPEGKGFVEVLKQAASDKEAQVQVSFYFLDAERRTLGSAPTAGRLKLEGPKSQPIDLGPGPDGSLITPPMADPGELAGVLTTTVDGKEVPIPIAIR